MPGNGGIWAAVHASCNVVAIAGSVKLGDCGLDTPSKIPSKWDKNSIVLQHFKRNVKMRSVAFIRLHRAIAPAIPQDDQISLDTHKVLEPIIVSRRKYMNKPIRNRGIASVILGMLSSMLVEEPRAVAQISTFENFSEGEIGSSFVDPASGILFTDPVYNFPGGVFSIEHCGLSIPPDMPGNLLTGNAYGIDGTFGLTAGFGFTLTLPTPSAYFQMDEIYFPEYGSSFSIEVAAYASNGQRVLLTSVLLPNTFPSVGFVHSEFESAMPVSTVVVTTPSSSAVGFDDIGVPVPEPSQLAGLLTLVGGASVWGLCRKKRANIA
jgi:hypothetical protein